MNNQRGLCTKTCTEIFFFSPLFVYKLHGLRYKILSTIIIIMWLPVVTIDNPIVFLKKVPHYQHSCSITKLQDENNLQIQFTLITKIKKKRQRNSLETTIYININKVLLIFCTNTEKQHAKEKRRKNTQAFLIQTLMIFFSPISKFLSNKYQILQHTKIKDNKRKHNCAEQDEAHTRFSFSNKRNVVLSGLVASPPAFPVS